MGPALHLASWSRRDLYGPGPRICAMAAPRRWERGDGSCAVVAPRADHLRDLQSGRISLGDYQEALERSLSRAAELDELAPGCLGYVTVPGVEDDCVARPRPVPTGASLLCACAAPGSPRRVHPCHLEILAPYLVVAGWDVVLWGRALKGSVGRDGAPDLRLPYFADTGEFYDPAVYGWPSAHLMHDPR